MGEHNIFQPGLVYDYDVPDPSKPWKQIVYAEHPEEGWRVYLRVVTFITVLDSPDEEITNKFIVVKSRKSHIDLWEAPKGGVEPEDFDHRSHNILETLKHAARRESGEEAKLYKLMNLFYLNKYFEGTESNYGPNKYVQYHFFQAFVSWEDFEKSRNYFDTMNAQPEQWNNLPEHLSEKNNIGFYNKNLKIFGKWSLRLIGKYMNTYVPPLLAPVPIPQQQQQQLPRAYGGAAYVPPFRR